jgi:hypothetical protein
MSAFGGKADRGDAFSTARRRELLSERGSDSLISEAPSHNTAIGIMPPVPALRPNAVPRVKFVHGAQALTETTGRHDHVYEVRIIALGGLCALAAFVAGHGFTISKAILISRLISIRNSGSANARCKTSRPMRFCSWLRASHTVERFEHIFGNFDTAW